MTWTRIDDGFAEHNKVVGLSDAALRLWLMVSCWSRKQQNLKHEGKFPASLLVHIGQNRWPEKRAQQLAAELVAANGGGLYEHGLWLETHDGWLIHDWHVYGIVGQEPDSLSAKRSDAGKRGAASRWQVDGKHHGKSMANTMAPHELAKGESMPPIPIPKPDQNKNPAIVEQEPDVGESGLNSFSPDPEKLKLRAAAQQVFDAWRSATGHGSAKFDNKRRARIMARFRDGFTPEQLVAAIQNRVNDPYLMGSSGRVYDGVETLLRDVAQVERLIALNAPMQPRAQHRADLRNEAQDRNADHDTRERLQASKRVRAELEQFDRAKAGGNV